MGFCAQGQFSAQSPCRTCCRHRIGPQRGSLCHPFLWDLRKFHDRIKAHLVIPQLVARGYPIGIFALNTFTHQSPRCLQVGNGFSDVITDRASSILAGCFQSCSWARVLLFELVKSLEYVFLGSVCEEHIDDLSQFATSSSRIQQLRDAARIGKEVRDGTAKLGLTLSCKSTLLANDKSLGMLIVAHLVADGVPMCQGTAATDLGIETAAGNRRCASNQWKRIWKGRRRAKRVYRLCRMNPAAQILTMTGIHPFQVHGHTAKHDVQKFENGAKTRACAISTVAWLFGTKRVPQVATRVEQISEWVKMWRGSDSDTRRRIRKLRTEIAPILANDPRRWNEAAGSIFATICSVLEADWMPRSPGFWQSPDASATLDGALFNKAQIVDCFSRHMEMQMWKQAAGHSLSAGMEKRHHYRCRQGSQESIGQREEFHICACAGFSRMWSDR